MCEESNVIWLDEYIMMRERLSHHPSESFTPWCQVIDLNKYRKNKEQENE